MTLHYKFVTSALARLYALRQALEDLHLRQMRSPDHSLENSVAHIRHFRAFAAGGVSVAGSGFSEVFFRAYLAISVSFRKRVRKIEKPPPNKSGGGSHITNGP